MQGLMHAAETVIGMVEQPGGSGSQTCFQNSPLPGSR